MLEYTYGSRTIAFGTFPSEASDVLTIRINSEKKVSVFVPAGISEKEIIEIVRKKSKWIIDKFNRIDELKWPSKKPEYVSGESFLFKGKLLRLKIAKVRMPEHETVHTDTSTLFCRTMDKSEAKVQKMLMGWYVEMAKEYLSRRTQRIASKMRKAPRTVFVRNQLCRWGSCTKSGDILLNWRIIMALPSVIDYVIVHELAHLEEKKHSKKFWKTIKAVMPKYEEKKDWLRVNGPLLRL